VRSIEGAEARPPKKRCSFAKGKAAAPVPFPLEPLHLLLRPPVEDAVALAVGGIGATEASGVYAGLKAVYGICE